MIQSGGGGLTSDSKWWGGLTSDSKWWGELTSDSKWGGGAENTFLCNSL